jgi:chromosome segregation ATPase
MPFNLMVPAPQEHSIIGQIEVSIPNVPPELTQAFLLAVCKRLNQALEGAYDQELASLRRQIEVTRQEVNSAEQRLRDLQSRRRDLLAAGQTDLSPDAVMDQTRRLDLERQRLEMDMIGQQARLKALQQQIQATGERSLKESADDPAIKPLEQKLAQLVEQLKLLEQQYQAGMTPQSEVQKARIAVSEAEAQLAERRRRLMQGGGDVLGKLNTDLAMLSVAAAETEARLKYVREQMEKTKQLLAPADEYELKVAMEMPAARRSYEIGKQHLEELERRLDAAVPPTITVIGGAASKPAK